MYFIINKTTNKSSTISGSWPSELLELLIKAGNEVIVISLYSNTIKVPIKTEMYGELEIDWVNYNIPKALLRQFSL